MRLIVIAKARHVFAIKFIASCLVRLSNFAIIRQAIHQKHTQTFKADIKSLLCIFNEITSYSLVMYVCTMDNVSNSDRQAQHHLKSLENG